MNCKQSNIMKLRTVIIMLLCAAFMQAQDLSSGLQVVNDLNNYPMQNISKPAYLDSYVDPSFGTTIRRISNVGNDGVVKPMYSTIQAWNADESYMIVYERGRGHQLLDGMTYQFIRYLDDIRPGDIEQIFWDFDDPDIFYYVDKENNDFIRYRVSNSSKQVIVNLGTLTNCGNIVLGDDVQMMSWDSDVIGFRCNNQSAYYYRISTGQLREFNLVNNNVLKRAPMPSPSGNYFYHGRKIYNSSGNLHVNLNEIEIEHACNGKLANGGDAYYTVAFDPSPNGGCVDNIIAHNMQTGECTPLIGQDQGYPYSQSSTHISALAHKNTQSGWVAASMVGKIPDGQSLLNQELVLARADAQGNVTVCRIGHHRSDKNQFGYFAEPHATISPTGTRVIFASDWSGSQDGQSVDTYVVELPTFGGTPPPPPPPPPTGNNSLTWNPTPTSISTGNNSFTMDYSIDQSGIVFIQVFDKDWNRIDYDFTDVSAGADRITFNLDVPNGTASENDNRLQAFLLSSDWESEFVRLELDLDSGSTPPPPPPPTGGNSLTWNPTPTSISTGNNSFSMDYSIDQSGVVFIQIIDENWNKIDENFTPVSAGTDRITLNLDIANGAASSNNYLQAKLLDSGWGDIGVPMLEETLNSSGNKLVTESIHFNVFPNPFNHAFNVEYHLTQDQPVSIQLFTREGKLIKTIKNKTSQAAGNHTETITIDNLPSGMYLLHLTTSDSHGVQKLVKF